MGKPGIVVLLFLGTLTPSLGITQNHHLIQSPKNWTEAQKYCRKNFDDLATTGTKEDWINVQNLIGNLTTAAWTGNTPFFYKWKWSLSNQIINNNEWILSNLQQYNHYYSSTVNDSCALFINGTLYEERCANQYKSVCYNQTTNTYIAIETSMSWWAAQSYCRKNYTDLTSMRNASEKQEIMNVTRGSEKWWTGLYTELWCCVVTQENEFYEPSDREFPFICSGNPKQKLVSSIYKIELKTKGSLNLNDVLLQEAILKQLENKLKNQTINQFTLRWKKSPNGNVFNKKKGDK
ncbi:uncharacterized protein LOC121657240 [Melanotaenia boesemani]|uniref:uncharacterized protein LOC121657240 n=1 Tax=Melanotaenia boesemani TaxID=1250792 RepID=UPI001C03D399|nr:uncharacterized protein LOC121657240 [Melanotaenia boesemani]